MVAQFLRLRLTLLGNTFKRSPMQLIGMGLAIAYGLVIAAIITYGIAALRAETVDVARAIIVVFGSAVVLAFLLLPLVFGADDAIDARRFSLFGVSSDRLAVAIALAACISLPTLVVTAFSIAQIVTWSRGPVVLFALLAAVIIIPTCVLASRVSTAVASLVVTTRRARDAAGVVLLLVFAVAAPLLALLATLDWQSRALPIARRVASVLTWTPLGAIWSVPGDAADGRLDAAFIKLGIALVFLALLAFAWRALVARLVVTPGFDAETTRNTGLGWFDRLPSTPTGAIAARSLSYWARDARYRVALVVIPVVPIIMVLALIVAGVPADVIVWIPVPVMSLFLGWMVHNDVAYDSSAFWLHVSANTSGRHDRLGRIAPALALGVPLAIVGSIVSGLVVGNAAIIPALIGLSLCVLLAGLGISSVISATAPYASVHPGDSPFAAPQATGSTGSVVQSLSFILTVVVAVPVVALVIVGGLTSPIWYWAALVVGLALGLAVLYFGILIGARVVTRRGPELLAFTLRN